MPLDKCSRHFKNKGLVQEKSKASSQIFLYLYLYQTPPFSVLFYQTELPSGFHKQDSETFLRSADLSISTSIFSREKLGSVDFEIVGPNEIQIINERGLVRMAQWIALSLPTQWPPVPFSASAEPRHFSIFSILMSNRDFSTTCYQQ